MRKDSSDAAISFSSSRRSELVAARYRLVWMSPIDAVWYRGELPSQPSARHQPVAAAAEFLRLASKRAGDNVRTRRITASANSRLIAFPNPEWTPSLFSPLGAKGMTVARPVSDRYLKGFMAYTFSIGEIMVQAVIDWAARLKSHLPGPSDRASRT